MDDLILYAKAFSDQNRLNIVALLQREKELCVCEICDTLNLSQPLVSRHLKQLKNASIVESRKEGKWIVYGVCSQRSKLLQVYLDELAPLATELSRVIACENR